MSREKLRVIAYDMQSSRSRSRVAATIQTVGVRIQKSVYEARLSNDKLDQLISEIRPEFEPGDKLRIYTVPDNALPHCRSIGGSPVADGSRFWMI